MKLAEKAEDISLDDDPRPMDRVAFQRLKLLVWKERVSPVWGSVLYALHELGRISNDQREAGDKYWSVVEAHKRLQATDPEDLIPEARDLAYRRIERAKEKFNDSIHYLGIHRKFVDWVVLEDLWPTSEVGHHKLRHGLTALSCLFSTGRTKGEPN